MNVLIKFQHHVREIAAATVVIVEQEIIICLGSEHPSFSVKLIHYTALHNTTSHSCYTKTDAHSLDEFRHYIRWDFESVLSVSIQSHCRYSAQTKHVDEICFAVWLSITKCNTANTFTNPNITDNLVDRQTMTTKINADEYWFAEKEHGEWCSCMVHWSWHHCCILSSCVDLNQLQAHEMFLNTQAFFNSNNRSKL